MSGGATERTAADIGMKAWNYPLSAIAANATLNSGYVHLMKLRLETAASLSKIAMHNWTFADVSATVLTASLWSVDGLDFTREVFCADASTLMTHLRGRVLNLGGSYEHLGATGPSPFLYVGLRGSVSTMPTFYKQAVDYAGVFRDDTDTEIPPPGELPWYGMGNFDDTTTAFTLDVGTNFYEIGNDFWVAVG